MIDVLKHSATEDSTYVEEEEEAVLEKMSLKLLFLVICRIFPI